MRVLRGERKRRNILSYCANANANDQELAEADSTEARNTVPIGGASSPKFGATGDRPCRACFGITVIIAIIYVNHCRSE